MKLWPLKYSKGLSKTKKIKRSKEIAHFSTYDWKDPRAYKGFQTDKGVRTKSSSYTKRWYRQFPDAHSLKQKAEATDCVCFNATCFFYQISFFRRSRGSNKK